MSNIPIVSVTITNDRDDKPNLLKSLQSVIDQDYPAKAIIIINSNNNIKLEDVLDEVIEKRLETNPKGELTIGKKAGIQVVIMSLDSYTNKDDSRTIAIKSTNNFAHIHAMLTANQSFNNKFAISKFVTNLIIFPQSIGAMYCDYEEDNGKYKIPKFDLDGSCLFLTKPMVESNQLNSPIIGNGQSVIGNFIIGHLAENLLTNDVRPIERVVKFSKFRR